MRRIVFAVAFFIAYCFSAGCGSGFEPGTADTTSSSLTVLACTAFHQSRTVDVTFLNGTCVRYLMPSSPANGQYLLVPGGTTIGHIDTGSNAAAWVCDTSSPRGFTEAPYAPCWSGSINNGYRRVRGAYQDAPIYAYGGVGLTITGIVGRSAVINLGTLPSPPYCGSQTALYWNQFGPARNADNGMDSYTASNDPANGPGSNLTAPWPSGDSGSPCLVNASPSGYAEIYYSPF